MSLKIAGTLSISGKQTPRDRTENFVFPSVPESGHSLGNAPKMNPIKTQVTSTVFFSKSIAATPDNPIKPTAIPSMDPLLSDSKLSVKKGFNDWAIHSKDHTEQLVLSVTI